MNSASVGTNRVVASVVSMGVLVIVIAVVFIIVAVHLFRAKSKVQTKLMEIEAKEKVQVYEEIDPLQLINSMKNVAYEAPPKQQAICEP